MAHLHLVTIPMRVGRSRGPMILRVALNAWTEDDEGNKCLGADCQTENELDHLIDLLIADLEAIRQRGKSALK